MVWERDWGQHSVPVTMLASPVHTHQIHEKTLGAAALRGRLGRMPLSSGRTKAVNLNLKHLFLHSVTFIEQRIKKK